MPITQPARLARRQLADEVATHIRDLIMSGQLRRGQFIRLEEMAATLGVSVTPVREALTTLRSEDMVELEPHRGYVVVPISRRDIEDMFDLQADLAGELAARAAARLSPGELERLTAIHDELSVAADQTRIERLEYEFHREINRAADSRKLSRILAGVSRYLPQHFYSADPGWRSDMLRAHADIIAALRTPDAVRARAAMSSHVLDGRDILLTHLEATGMWT